MVTGLGIAGQYPMGAELCSRPRRRRCATAPRGSCPSAIAVAAGAGPFALGALADATSTHTAFLVVPALMMAALVLLAATAAGQCPVPAPAGDGRYGVTAFFTAQSSA